MRNIFLVCLIFFKVSLYAQYEFKLSNEILKKQNNELILLGKTYHLRFAGYNNDQLVLFGRELSNNKSISIIKVYYDELSQSITNIENMYFNKDIVLKYFEKDSVSIFQGYYNVPESYEYNNIYKIPFINNLIHTIWMTTPSHTKQIMTTEHTIEQEIVVNISNDGVIYCNPYIDEYSKRFEKDSFFIYYDVKQFLSKKIYCKRCINTISVNEKIYYGQEFYLNNYTDDYDYNIIEADINDINNKQLIAENVRLLKISDDGRYVLGWKFLYGRNTYVIVDIEAKRYEYIIGRNYGTNIFYSKIYKCFGFIVDNYIIYVEYPDVFLLNSIGKDSERLIGNKNEREEFWNTYKHERIE